MADKPSREWEGPHRRRLVLTERGRLLIRYANRRRFIVLRAYATEEEAEQIARVQMMNRVAVH